MAFCFPRVLRNGYATRLHISIGVFTFIALQCIVDGPDLRLCRFSAARQAGRTRSRGIHHRRGVSRPIAPAGDIARLSKRESLARGSTISRLATTARTVVDRRCRYSAVEKLTQNTVDCVKSTAD